LSPQQTSSRGSAATVVKALICWVLLWLGISLVVGLIVSAVCGLQDLKPPPQVLYAVLSLTSPAVFAYATWRRVGWDVLRRQSCRSPRRS
jgi:hypothetical protein